MKTTNERTPQAGLTVVGVGAAVAGLEALEHFLHEVCELSGLAYVILFQTERTLSLPLIQRLQACTPLKIHVVEEDTKIRPDCIYLASAQHDLSLCQGILQFSLVLTPGDSRRPINFFLRSLAEDRREHGVGVLLSGVESDGLLGLTAIKKQGGVAVIQKSAPAKQGTLAVDFGMVDIVAAAAELPGRIVEYLRRSPKLHSALAGAADRINPEVKADPSTVLGQAVKLRRQELGWSQEQLAGRAGLNRTYITDVERGARNLSLSTIDRLAHALEIPMTGLLHKLDQTRKGAKDRRTQLNPSTTVEILLVEDNPRDVELTLRALRRANLVNHIHVERDGAEALDYLFGTGRHAGRKPDTHLPLVLLDLKLPRVDGLEVLRTLRADPRTQAISVVILTSSAENQDKFEALGLGVDAYMVKPVDFQQLTQVTAQLKLLWTLTWSVVRSAE